MTHKKQDEETLRDEIASIIYGADWKDTDIAKAFKPDVEAVMSLITERDKKRDAYIIGEDYKHGDVLDGVPLPKVHRDLLKHEHAQQRKRSKEVI